MARTAPVVDAPFVVRLTPVHPVSDDELLELSARNPELRLERSAEGELIIMAPAGAESGRQGANVVLQLGTWARAQRNGVVFDSSAGFRLRSGAVRSPDASWVRGERWSALPEEERRRFPSLCPDLVVEIRSPSDPLPHVEEKVREWVAAGARLALLVDPLEERVQVHRPGREPVALESPRSVACDPELPGFVLELDEVWSP